MPMINNNVSVIKQWLDQGGDLSKLFSGTYDGTSFQSLKDKVDLILKDAPESLDTFKELANLLNNDKTGLEAILKQLESKVDKIDGKRLSTNDFTDADKEKLDGIEEGANKTIVDSELLETSTNPVQNKVVLEALNEKAGSIINSVSGEAIQLTDSSNEKLRGLKVFGKTEQQKSTGINILNSYGFCASNDTKLKPSMTRSVSNTYGTTISTTDFANELVITQTKYPNTSNPDSYVNGYFTIGTQKLLAGNTYTFVYEFEVTNNPLNSKVHQIVVESGVGVLKSQISTNRICFTFTCVNGTEGIEIRCCGRSMIMKNFMLLEGAVALEDLPDFEPYTGGKPAPTPDNPQDLINIGNAGSMELYVKDSDEKQTFIINTRNGLKGVAVENNGNYTDSNGQQWVCDEVNFERGVYIQRISEHVVTGQENWAITTNTNSVGNVRYDCDRLLSLCLGNACLCSHYQYRGVNPFYSEGVWVANRSNKGGLRIMSSYTTVDELKLFLQSQYSNGTPVKVFYIIETPIETPLTEEQISVYKELQTYKPKTSITNNENAYMKVDYVADTKNYIDNKFAELQQAILSTGGNV